MKQNVFYFYVPNVRYINEYIFNMNNPKINTFIENVHEEDVTTDEVLQWIQRHQNDYTFSMVNREDEALIGNCSLSEFDNNSATLGILISQNFQNQGFGTEVITELIRIAFQELNLVEVRLIVFSHNRRAIHVYENLGFREYDRITAVTTRDNEFVDDIYMRLTRE